MRILTWLAIAVLFCACGNETRQLQQAAQTSSSAPAEKLTGNWYRHYEGTIAGQRVAADIYYADNALSGTYTYDKQDIILELTGETDPKQQGRYLIYESIPTEHIDDNDYHKNSRWEVAFDKDKLAGKWISKDGKSKQDISLTLSAKGKYYPFDILQHSDSVVTTIKTFKTTARIAHQWSVPSADMDAADRAFIEKTHLSGMECTGADYRTCVDQHIQEFFLSYRENIDTGITEDESGQYNYESGDWWDVIYNKQGMVILEHRTYDYTGGAHGMHTTDHCCIDMLEKRVWKLTDVLITDNAELPALLEAETRKLFRIPATDNLSDRLLVDSMEITDNFYFTTTGITFVYNPYEVASYADGVVSIFIPFTKLGNMLQPAFKKRMHIP